MRAVIIHEKSTNEYIIKILKRNWWWLLLLLLILLPLLLLIKCNKDINIKVTNPDSKMIDGAKVYFDYPVRYLYDFNSNKFFASKRIQRTNSTNKDGIAKFPMVQYSVFQWLFYGSEKCNVNAFKDCVASDSLKPPFNILKAYPPFPVALKVRKYDYNFKVVDRKTLLSLVNAQVSVKIDKNDGKSYDKNTDATGMAYFISSIPLCTPLIIKASCKGYHDTTFKVSSSSELLGDISNRTIKLKPIVPALVILVKNSNSKSPLPYANVTLTDANGKVIEVRQTNSGGNGGLIPGSVEFKDLPENTNIKICASKEYFKSNCITGTAGAIKKWSMEQRTIYLEPEGQDITLIVVNEENRQAIAGANVQLSSQGKTYNGVTADDGTVTFAGLSNDQSVSAVASRPEFNTNSTHIRNANITDLKNNLDKRTIPLRPNAPPVEPPSNVPRLDCNVPINVTAGNYLGSTTKIDLVNPNGKFVVWYDMQKIPDEMIITCEQTGAVIYKTPGRVSGQSTITVDYTNCRFVIITISQQNKKGTAWKYRISCP